MVASQAFDCDCQLLRRQNLYYKATKVKQKHHNIDNEPEDFWTLANQQVGVAHRLSNRMTDDDTVDAVPLTDDDARHRRPWYTSAHKA
jgi:hypothetical protein